MYFIYSPTTLYYNRPNQVSWNDNETADTQLGRFQEKGVETV